MKNNSEIILDGEKYISSKQAANITGYANDYIGQLCRLGKIKCQRVGRDWIVSEKSILEYRSLPKLIFLNNPRPAEMAPKIVSKNLAAPSDDLWDKELFGEQQNPERNSLNYKEILWILKPATFALATISAAAIIVLNFTPIKNNIAKISPPEISEIRASLALSLPALSIPDFQPLISNLQLPSLPNITFPSLPFSLSDIAQSLGDIKNKFMGSLSSWMGDLRKIAYDFVYPPVFSLPPPAPSSPDAPPLSQRTKFPKASLFRKAMRVGARLAG